MPVLLPILSQMTPISADDGTLNWKFHSVVMADLRSVQYKRSRDS